MQVRLGVAVIVLALGACKGKQPRDQAAAKDASVASSPDVTADPCASSKDRLAQIEQLRTEGRIGRAHRDAEGLQRACPGAGAEAVVTALAAELEVDAPVPVDGDPEFLANLDRRAAAAHWRRGELDEAIARLTDALAMAPSPEILVQRARLHEEAGHAADARRDHARAVALAERNGKTAARPRVVAGAAAVRTVAFAPDGKLISIAKDGAVATWDVATGRAERVVELDQLGEAMDVGGGVVAVMAGGFTVRDAATGAAVGKPPSEDLGMVLEVAVSPDGQRVAVASADAGTSLYEVATGTVTKLVPDDALLVLAFSPDGSMVAGTTDEDRVVTVFDVATAKPITRLVGHTDSLRAIAWSADGKTLASGGHDRTIRTWDAQTAEPGPVFEPRNDVFALAFRPDGKVLAVGGRGFLELVARASSDPPVALGVGDSAVSLEWAPDGSTLAAGRDGGGISIFDGGGQHVRALGLGVARAGAAAFHGDRLVWAGADGGLYAWDLAGNSGPSVHSLAGAAESFALSPDGTIAAVSVARGVVDLRAVVGGAALPPLPPAKGTVKALRFRPDGQRLAANVNNKLQVWDLEATTLSDALVSGLRDAPAWSADGARLAVATDDGIVVLGKEVGGTDERVSRPLPDAQTVAFAPDGSLAAATRDGVVVIWDASGVEQRRFTPKGASDRGFRALAFSPDGTRLALVPTTDATVLLVDPAGAAIASLTTSDSYSSDLAWSADGKLLAISGGELGIELFTAEGKRVAELAASLSGDWLVAADDGRVEGSPRPRFLAWTVGELRLPAAVAWDREQTPGLLASLVRP